MKPSLWSRLIQALRECVTGKDNATHDLSRWGLLGSLVAVLAHDYYQITHGITVPVRDFALSLAALLGLGGAGIGFKSSTEPTTPPQELP